MAEGPAVIARVRAIEPYRIVVSFDDGTEQTIDLEPMLCGDWFGPLRDRALFDAVTIKPSGGGLEWPTGASITSWTLHDWPVVGAGHIALVQKAARRLRHAHVGRKISLVCGIGMGFTLLAEWTGLFGWERPSMMSTVVSVVVILNSLVLLRFYPWPRRPVRPA